MDVSRVQKYASEIGNLRKSPDQSIRWTANRISQRLGLAPIEQERLSGVIGRYQGKAIVPRESQLHGGTTRTSFNIFPDSLDPYELIAPFQDEIEIIAEAADLEAEAVVVRVIECMRELSHESNWNSAAEQKLRSRMHNAKLAFPYRRPRASHCRRAIFHVLAELADGGLIASEGIGEFEKVFRHYDANLVFRRPLARPLEIRVTNCPKYNEFKAAWVAEVQNCGVSELCRSLNGRTVVAEQTCLKPAGNAMASETRASSLVHKSLRVSKNSAGGSQFFPRLIRQLVTNYHEAALEADGFLAAVHLGFGYDTPGDGWLAFDPALARSLDWNPTPSKYLAWEKNGEVMVETLWWADGCLDHSMPFYRKLEVGEGWLVVASDRALSEIKTKIGPLKRACAVTREIVENRDPLNRTNYFESE